MKYVLIKIFKNLEKREVDVLKIFEYKNVIKYYDDWNVDFFIYIFYLVFNVKYVYLYIVL